jgi:hypothetical protein
LTTEAERSGNVRTGRYAEVEQLCPAFQQRWPGQVRCFEFGRTPEGRPMLALAASADGVLDAATARQRQRPVAFMQGGIHAGEIDGKDAGFLALRRILEGSAAPGVLRNVTLVFIPVLSPDGHERFGRWNRPNQNGPEEMGWRTTAQNLNLNRDYVKADAPEMHALLGLLNDWDPVLYADLHATNGAKFEHDISYSVSPTLAGDAQLQAAGILVRDELMKRAKARGSLPVDFYPSFVRDDDPTSGIAANVPPARFSQQYWAARNRLGVLVETHSWKDYPTRVRITYDAILDMLQLAATNGTQWRAITQAADERARRIGGTNVVLTYQNTEEARTIEFRGYEYTREMSPISGALMTRYDDRKPQIWRIPLWNRVRPAITVEAPRGGYLVPAAHAVWVGEKLRLHGIEFTTLAQPIAKARTQTFRASTAKPSASTFEGRTTITLEGEWQAEPRDLPRGSLFVPIAQPKSGLLMTLLEPRNPDSLVSWGYFNAAFERKEYMEAYVAEEVAAQMLAGDAAMKTDFERKLREEPDFAANPSARLDFFYRRHASFDERFNLYPVLRIDEVPRQ